MRKAVGASLLTLALSGAAIAAAQTPPGEPPVAYVVKPGDTLIGLGRNYLNRPSDYRRVQKANGVQDPRRLRPGSQLNIDPNLLKSTPIAATLSAVTGSVQVETNGQRTPARVGMPLSEGQWIITGPGAFATFELEDASRITLPSNTRVRIAKLRQMLINKAPHRVFQLEQGKGTISATPTPTPGARFEVRTPVSVSAVRGTEFRVGASADSAQTEVLKGAVGVDAGASLSDSAPIQAGFGVSASTTGVGGPVELLPGPKLAAGGQTQSGALVRFSLEPVAGAASYRLLLARDAGFFDIFAEATTQTTSQQNPIADFGQVANGTYFVRLTAIDPGGLEGLPADYSFDRDLDALEIAPRGAPREGQHRQFLFRWSAAGDGVRSYRFQMFANGDAKTPVVDRAGLTEPSLTLTDLAAGTYGWRVTTLCVKDDVTTERQGPLQQLQIGK
jgi:hypothetical protein